MIVFGLMFCSVSWAVTVSKTSDYAGVQTYTVTDGNSSSVVVVTNNK